MILQTNDLPATCIRRILKTKEIVCKIFKTLVLCSLEVLEDTTLKMVDSVAATFNYTPGCQEAAANFAGRWLPSAEGRGCGACQQMVRRVDVATAGRVQSSTRATSTSCPIPEHLPFPHAFRYLARFFKGPGGMFVGLAR